VAKSQRWIGVPPQVAFAYLSDLTRHTEWAMNPGLKVEQTSPGAVTTGATFRSTGSQFGLKLGDELKVTHFEPPFRFGYEATGLKGPLASSGYVIHHAIELEKAEGGTLVTKEMRIGEMGIPFSLFKPVTELVLKRRMAKDLKRIAAKLEAADASG
jgi:Polyketide cyclase / dehydrase and lipid transport